MYFNFGHIFILLIVTVIISGVIYLFFLKPIITKKFREKNKKLESDILVLKQTLSDIKGADATLNKLQVEHKQNISIIKTRGLITQYNKWKKPMRHIRVLLSFMLGIIITICIAYLFRNSNAMKAVDFVVIGFFMFLFSFTFWGKGLETYWKFDIEDKMKKEFFNIIQFSKNPIETQEKLSEWMKDHKDINDDFKHSIEELFDKWLKEYLKIN